MTDEQIQCFQQALLASRERRALVGKVENELFLVLLQFAHDPLYSLDIMRDALKGALESVEGHAYGEEPI